MACCASRPRGCVVSRILSCALHSPFLPKADHSATAASGQRHGPLTNGPLETSTPTSSPNEIIPF